MASNTEASTLHRAVSGRVPDRIPPSNEHTVSSAVQRNVRCCRFSDENFWLF